MYMRCGNGVRKLHAAAEMLIYDDASGDCGCWICFVVTV
jgi:hypothetical protein